MTLVQFVFIYGAIGIIAAVWLHVDNVRNSLNDGRAQFEVVLMGLGWIVLIPGLLFVYHIYDPWEAHRFKVSTQWWRWGAHYQAIGRKNELVVTTQDLYNSPGCDAFF